MVLAHEPTVATLPSDSSLASAVRYFECITARVRAGQLPDAITTRIPRRFDGIRRKPQRNTPAQRAKIERLLRAGLLTHREIAERCGCSHSNVAALSLALGGMRQVRLH